MIIKSKLCLELTLAVIKPHIIKVPYALQCVRDVILSNGFYIIRTKRVILTKDKAEKFYLEHRNKFFYKRLVTFMCSGPVDIHILAQENAIQKWRNVMGPTKVYQAQFSHPETIRGSLGLSDTRNAAHGSDSPESAAREIKLCFPQFSICNWFKDEAQHFSPDATITFDANEFIHRIQRYPYRKKSMGVRSGKRGGHRIAPSRPIHVPGNVVYNNCRMPCP